MKKVTVIQHVIDRLYSLGITDIFGIPGDYSLPICDAIAEHKKVRWIGSCNELNSAYAADGYSRLKGFGCLTTAFGVGELSAINGISGAFSENLPLFQLVGAPNQRVQQSRAIVHHSYGTGEFDRFHEMAKHAVCASAVLTAENAAYEVERLIAQALYHRRPVYMSIAQDVANLPLTGRDVAPINAVASDPQALQAALKAIVQLLNGAKQAVLLPGILLQRFSVLELAEKLIERSGLPFATMMSDKALLDETHPQYIGMYNGALMNEGVRRFVEEADCILALGAYFSDFNTGAFTAKIAKEKLIQILPHSVQVGYAQYPDVQMADILQAIIPNVKKRKLTGLPQPDVLGAPKGDPRSKITSDYLFSSYERFIKPNDIIVIETGPQHMGLAFGLMKKGVSFLNQTLWCSIGWATAAAVGAGIASSKSGRRLLLITGEGAHQFSLQELSVFQRYNLKPIVICVNNDGYMIERMLCKDPDAEYNDIAKMEYHLLPKALGCSKWFTAKVQTCAELDEALNSSAKASHGAYVEVIMDKMAAPPFVEKLHQRVQQFYQP